MSNKRDVVIVSAVRTPFAKFGGDYKSISAVDLGSLVIKEALNRANITGDDVDEIIMGQVVPTGSGQVPARQAAVKAGIPYQVPSFSINKVCGSSMKAIMLGAQAIKAGDADVVVCGGMENMSRVPYISRETRWGARMNNITFEDGMVFDALWCPDNDAHMAVINGWAAKEEGVTREAQDKWAFRSQKLWAAAENERKFDDERMSIEIPSKKGNYVINKDPHPRPDTTLEMLQKMKPIIVDDGTVTAGNAPGINDGASAVIVMSRERAEKLEVPILATIRDYAQCSDLAYQAARAIGKSIQIIMDKNNLTTDDFELWEINEAFALTPLVCCEKTLGMDMNTIEKKVNVNGGAVAVGHPVAATGARLLMTLMYEMRRSGKKSGITGICSGMGQGDAIWITID